eukprot:TRINITY_DN28136_c0_g1_i1.p1 TRINITY_DN28136_c0_g1~~TRINITY_DN28136_c0_g1_i1.p1  ORF type:complete len:762 (+),score=181.12 TRINITY_DN28136_c0_g1_i1:146-2431(+)
MALDFDSLLRRVDEQVAAEAEADATASSSAKENKVAVNSPLTRSGAGSPGVEPEREKDNGELMVRTVSKKEQLPGSNGAWRFLHVTVPMSESELTNDKLHKQQLQLPGPEERDATVAASSDSSHSGYGPLKRMSSMTQSSKVSESTERKNSKACKQQEVPSQIVPGTVAPASVQQRLPSKSASSPTLESQSGAASQRGSGARAESASRSSSDWKMARRPLPTSQQSSPMPTIVAKQSSSKPVSGANVAGGTGGNDAGGTHGIRQASPLPAAGARVTNSRPFAPLAPIKGAVDKQAQSRRQKLLADLAWHEKQQQQLAELRQPGSMSAPGSSLSKPEAAGFSPSKRPAQRKSVHGSPSAVQLPSKQRLTSGGGSRAASVERLSSPVVKNEDLLSARASQQHAAPQLQFSQPESCTGSTGESHHGAAEVLAGDDDDDTPRKQQLKKRIAELEALAAQHMQLKVEAEQHQPGALQETTEQIADGDGEDDDEWSKDPSGFFSFQEDDMLATEPKDELQTKSSWQSAPLFEDGAWPDDPFGDLSFEPPGDGFLDFASPETSTGQFKDLPSPVIPELQRSTDEPFHTKSGSSPAPSAAADTAEPFLAKFGSLPVSSASADAPDLLFPKTGSSSRMKPRLFGLSTGPDKKPAPVRGFLAQVGAWDGLEQGRSTPTTDKPSLPAKAPLTSSPSTLQGSVGDGLDEVPSTKTNFLLTRKALPLATSPSTGTLTSSPPPLPALPKLHEQDIYSMPGERSMSAVSFKCTRAG